MIKTLLVHLTGIGQDEAVLHHALNLARPFGAHLDCVHVRASKAQLVIQAAQSALGDEGANIGDTVKRMELASRETALSARKTFETICRDEGIASADVPPGPSTTSIAWREASGAPAETLTGEARFNDLTVLLGGGTKQGGLDTRDLARVLLESGRPLVVTPPSMPKNPIRTIAVAWKDAPESARALSAAMPLLRKTEKVVVLTASEGEEKAAQSARSLDRVANHLRWHGINADGRHIDSAGRGASAAIVDAAHDEGADLLVMGGYGRGRLTEIIFGGFTRHVLDGIGIPAFLFH